MPVTFGGLVQDYVGAQCGVLLEASAAIADRDESVVHPARVAIRRLRAALRSFGAVYDREDRSRFARELRWMGGLLGEVRDLQVLGERFGTDDTPVAARRLISDELDRDRTEAWRAVGESLAGARGAALLSTIARWRVDPPFTPTAGRPADRAKKRVHQADVEVSRCLDVVRESADAAAAAEALHDARKAAKRHRYAVELAQPVLGAKAAATIERLRSLQDALGEHQDAVVALGFLQRIAHGAESYDTAQDLRDLIAQTRARTEDVAGVLRETGRLHGRR